MNQPIMKTRTNELSAPEMTTAELSKRALFNRFVEYADVKPKSVETYRKNISRFLQWLMDNGINRPTRSDVVAYRDYLRENYKPTTVQGYIVAVRLFFQWLHQEGLSENLAENLKGAKISNNFKKDALTARQFKNVLDEIDDTTLTGKRDKAMLILIVSCGLRTIEVSRAKIEDIQLQGDTLGLYVLGKGRDEKDFQPMNHTAERAIKEYLKERNPKSLEEPLFTSTSHQNAGATLSTQTVSKTVKKYLRLAGYDSERLTAHSLRHTTVTMALLAGQSAQEVSAFARHSNINTTMIYAHNLEKTQNKCSDAVERMLLG